MGRGDTRNGGYDPQEEVTQPGMPAVEATQELPAMNLRQLFAELIEDATEPADASPLEKARVGEVGPKAVSLKKAWETIAASNDTDAMNTLLEDLDVVDGRSLFLPELKAISHDHGREDFRLAIVGMLKELLSE